MEAMPSSARTLFRAALVIFVITVVIGILNGTDLWDPPRNTLLTHVHSGTLGWITLGVFGGAIWMMGDAGSGTGSMAKFAIVAIGAYVLAFWSVDLTDTTSIQRPIGGTLAFVAMTWVFVWALRTMAGKRWDVAKLGMILSLAFLVFGAVLGVLLGLQLADIDVVAAENSSRLAESHPGAMVIGFVVLAALALIEWLIQDESPSLAQGWHGVAGTIQMLLVFVAGVVLVVGFLVGNESLLQMGVPLQVLGAIVLLARHGHRLAPAGWSGETDDKFVRIAVVGLVVVVALIAYLIAEIIGGADFTELLGVALAMDHINFLLVSTSLIFAMMSKGSEVTERANSIIFWGLTIGVTGFAVGLVTEEAVLKRIFTPVLGLALLHGIFTYLRARPKEMAAS
jgi:hypothetical protein